MQALLNHPRNQNIEYIVEPHGYIYYPPDGNEPQEWEGITSLIKKYAPFDRQAVSKAVAMRDGRTQADVLAEWEKASDYGTEVHGRIEHTMETGVDDDRPEVKAVRDWMDRMNLQPVAQEMVVYCEKIKRATAIDQVAMDSRGRLVIMDYKTSKEIRYKPYKDKSGKIRRMEYPLTALPKTNFYQYSLQIGMEIKWLREYYLPGTGIELARRHWILHVRGGHFKPHQALHLQPEIEAIYGWELN